MSFLVYLEDLTLCVIVLIFLIDLLLLSINLGGLFFLVSILNFCIIFDRLDFESPFYFEFLLLVPESLGTLVSQDCIH